MKNNYLNSIKLYVEKEKSLDEMASYFNEHNVEIEVNNKDFETRCMKSPKVDKDEERSYVVEKTEIMLDTMMIATLPESLEYLVKYIEMLKFECSQKNNNIVRAKKGPDYPLFKKEQIIQKLNNSAKNYYDKKKMDTILAAFPMINTECEDNIVATADKYNLDREMLVKAYGKHLESIGQSKNVSEILDLRMIKEYLTSNSRIEDFCTDQKIKRVDFDKMIARIQSSHADIFNIINTKLFNQEEEKKAFYLEKAKEMAYLIQNGVGKDKIDFSIIDYYTMCNIPHEAFIQTIFSYNFREYGTTLKSCFGWGAAENGKFAIKNICGKVSKEVIKQSKLKVNGREYTEDDVDYVCELFEEYGIPKTEKTYLDGLKRLAKGQPVLPLKDNTYKKGLCRP